MPRGPRLPAAWRPAPPRPLGGLARALRRLPAAAGRRTSLPGRAVGAAVRRGGRARRAAVVVPRALPLAPLLPFLPLLPLPPLIAATWLLVRAARAEASLSGGTPGDVTWALLLAAAAAALAPVAGLLGRAARRRSAPAQAEAAIRRRLRALIGGIPHGAMTVSATGQVQLGNAALARMLGYAEWQLVDRDLRTFAPADAHERIAGVLAGVLWGDPPDPAGPDGDEDAPEAAGVTWEEHLRRADGTPLDVELTASPLVEPDGTRAVFVQVRLPAAERARRVPRHLVAAGSRDPATGLPDRATFGRMLEQALAATTAGTGVLLIDIDAFSALDARLGRRSADRLLRTLGERVRAAATLHRRAGDGEAGATDPTGGRDAEACVARFGGDEFLVLVPDLPGPAALRARAHTMLRAIEAPLEHDGRRITVTASIGGACTPASREPEPGAAARLLGGARAALDRARTAGGRRYVGPGAADATDEEPATGPAPHAAEPATWAERADAAPDRAHAPDMEDAFARALAAVAEAPDGAAATVCAAHFAVHQFPQVRLPGRRPTGAAAVLRWLPAGDAGRGAGRAAAELLARVGPAHPAAGRRLAAFLLDRVLAAVARAPGGTRVTVALPLAHATEVERALARSPGVDPARLLVAFTEAEVTARPRDALAAARALRARGVGVALGDFGLGEATLADLQRLEVTAICTDPRLLPAHGATAADLAILRGLAQLGEALGIEVIACGVDTPEQLHAAVRGGVTTCQGAALRAMPAAAGVRGADATGDATTDGTAAAADLPARGAADGTARGAADGPADGAAHGGEHAA